MYLCRTTCGDLRRLLLLQVGHRCRGPRMGGGPLASTSKSCRSKRSATVRAASLWRSAGGPCRLYGSRRTAGSISKDIGTKRGREHTAELCSDRGSYACGPYSSCVFARDIRQCLCTSLSAGLPSQCVWDMQGGSYRPDGWFSSSYGSQCHYGWPAPRRQTR